jgi:hypothetical protein
MFGAFIPICYGKKKIFAEESIIAKVYLEVRDLSGHVLVVGDDVAEGVPALAGPQPHPLPLEEQVIIPKILFFCRSSFCRIVSYH